MDENKITAIRVYMTYGAVDIPATDIEVNRMFDEINIVNNGITAAKFFTRNIVGYEIIREKPEVDCDTCHACGEY